MKFYYSTDLFANETPHSKQKITGHSRQNENELQILKCGRRNHAAPQVMTMIFCE